MIIFDGYYNEEVLKHLVVLKARVPLVYAVCDGMTSGMGTASDDVVPTILYPLLARAINLKYMVTEQDNSMVGHNLSHINEWKRLWLKTLLGMYPDPEISSWLQRSDEELGKVLKRRLAKLHENTIDRHAFHAFDWRFELYLRHVPEKTSSLNAE